MVVVSSDTRRSPIKGFFGIFNTKGSSRRPSPRPGTRRFAHTRKEWLTSSRIYRLVMVVVCVLVCWLTATLSFARIQRGQKRSRKKRYPSHPRYIACHFDGGPLSRINIIKRLDPHMDLYPTKRPILMSDHELEAQAAALSGKKSGKGMQEVFETDECKAQYDWQLTSYPTCAKIHEFDLTDEVKLINNGYWRDVFLLNDFDGAPQILKMMRYEHGFEGRNYDRHRRDALAMERLTESPHILDIYGFCGNSGLFQFSDGGDLHDAIWSESKDKKILTKLDRLHLASQVSIGVADMHNVDKEGQASIAHTDITPTQFLLIDGFYKLNDFNRARFIRWNRHEDKPCTYRVGNNPGKFRSPEEYNYFNQTEKVRNFHVWGFTECSIITTLSFKMIWSLLSFFLMIILSG
uniref:Protein kinase domain-containing protein n=1 Tax=Attheya septentrionalis TaxID=420275 RepID=A0A7S2UMR9_9STRA|mmetsp:Transcript_2968/g.5397  ORF Transcript_2968/g.5397 Transcript_2968/m.5397 type:complete len:406 (+) Transcript_2968:135-1352(+)